MNPTYLGEIELSEETLAHYGVKGMRWGRRKVRQLLNNNPIARRRRQNRHAASHLADDILTGRTTRNMNRSGPFRADQYGRLHESRGLYNDNDKPRRLIANTNNRTTSVRTVENRRAGNGANVTVTRDHSVSNRQLANALSSYNARRNEEHAPHKDKKKKK